MKKSRTYSACDILLPVLALAFFLGLLFVFGPCGPKEDGGWMSCHWAGQALRGLAAAMLVIALLHLLPGRAKQKMGLDMAMIPLAVLALLLPGRLISLCMMASMRCRSVMAPAVTVFAVLMIVLSILDYFLQRKTT